MTPQDVPAIAADHAGYLDTVNKVHEGFTELNAVRPGRVAKTILEQLESFHDQILVLKALNDPNLTAVEWRELGDAFGVPISKGDSTSLYRLMEVGALTKESIEKVIVLHENATIRRVVHKAYATRAVCSAHVLEASAQIQSELSTLQLPVIVDREASSWEGFDLEKFQELQSKLFLLRKRGEEILLGQAKADAKVGLACSGKVLSSC
eukprot:scaffold1667_cov258-Pinguiococcus_pyrenoidosus.AAC.2